MSTTGELILLTLGAFGVLIVMTVIGDAARLRMPQGRTSVMVETYMTRVQSWWAMVILLSLALLLGVAGVSLLFAVAGFAALREFLTLTTKSRADHWALALGFFVVLPLQFIFVGFGWAGLFTVFVPVYAFLLLPVISALRGNSDRFLMRVAETQWGLMIAVYCLSHVPALMTLNIDGYGGREVLLIAFLVIVVQAGDLVDLYFGRRFGRRKIAPGISPKTVEGVLAGLAAAVAIGAVLNWITPFGLWGAIGMAAAASTSGMAGNIVFAAIKRDRGVRDWSHLIPGQGGLIDQLDSVIFAAPIFYHLSHLVWT
ncbi:phosphatidate cytidylyltransferase [Loktanella sp. IMCC34160]|uniref:phosphatidate cytidylyltransferase n=1 Tax=Loktanella sp. IMCC34160 TaxID=2510646 RepID=UPI00101DA6CD|nr:phosphatidate cytidylyltransferase [Loktanella sp. IMCC34160]RYG90591.1 phosphatidate cytidylyltransferase [Loktanella sp. IMCC34160]